jgi:hypothetical protein
MLTSLQSMAPSSSRHQASVVHRSQAPSDMGSIATWPGGPSRGNPHKRSQYADDQVCADKGWLCVQIT